MGIRYEWRGGFEDAELEALHAIGFDHAPTEYGWRRRLGDHSLGWVCGFDDDALIGFVNVAWDGGAHAFIIDTLVAPSHRHRGVGTRLVEIAASHAREAGCEWLHADYDADLIDFYERACGFSPTSAGLLRLL